MKVILHILLLPTHKSILSQIQIINKHKNYNAYNNTKLFTKKLAAYKYSDNFSL